MRGSPVIEIKFTDFSNKIGPYVLPSSLFDINVITERSFYSDWEMANIISLNKNCLAIFQVNDYEYLCVYPNSVKVCCKGNTIKSVTGSYDFSHRYIPVGIAKSYLHSFNIRADIDLVLYDKVNKSIIIREKELHSPLVIDSSQKPNFSLYSDLVKSDYDYTIGNNFYKFSEEV